MSRCPEERVRDWRVERVMSKARRILNAGCGRRFRSTVKKAYLDYSVRYTPVRCTCKGYAVQGQAGRPLSYHPDRAFLRTSRGAPLGTLSRPITPV